MLAGWPVVGTKLRSKPLVYPVVSGLLRCFTSVFWNLALLDSGSIPNLSVPHYNPPLDQVHRPSGKQVGRFSPSQNPAEEWTCTVHCAELAKH